MRAISTEKSLNIKKRKRIQDAVLDWASVNLRDFPWRKNTTPYNILVAEFLLRRTTATAAARVFNGFIDRFPNVGSLANADENELEKMFRPIGCYKKRSEELKETALFIKEKYFGIIPIQLIKLEAIPNIGQYTAGAIRSLGHNKKESMVDSNIERIIRRSYSSIVPLKGKYSLIKRIAKFLIPERNHQKFNLALIDLGALICRYGIPRCHLCPIRSNCDYFLELKSL